MKYCILFLILFLALPISAKHLHLEKEYQKFWCNQQGGITEYKLKDNTRVDCLLSDYAVEVDFAQKVYESIGQALYYGLMTYRQPAVLIIIEDDNCQKYVNRLKIVADKYNIKVWTITPSDIKKLLYKRSTPEVHSGIKNTIIILQKTKK